MTVTNEVCLPQLKDWLTNAVQCGASDLHLVAGHPPVLRIHGELRQLESQTSLDGAQVRDLLTPLLSSQNLERFLADKNIDFSTALKLGDQLQRFRVNLFFCGQDMGACFRIIPTAIPDLAWAGFPQSLADHLAHFRNGLVLISGVTGSGKTTSLAMIINLLNREGGYRIITVEEPVEYLFPQSLDSLVTQREVGVDVRTFADGLKYGLRQDPDVILVGEIRDRETAQMALSAAETGHLVFSTLHTRDAKGAISRFADLFPQSAQPGICAQLAMSLRAVIAQNLLPSIQPQAKRELALEVMFNTSPISAAIRIGRVESIDNSILTGKSDGMMTMNESVKRLLKEDKIRLETAQRFVTDAGSLYR